MNRSPLFYPLSRGLDADAGGAADLQTDVMRFMAIISMCLVAIFALVRSIPAEAPAPDAPTAAIPVKATIPEQHVAMPEPAELVVLTHPALSQRKPEPAPVELHRPARSTPADMTIGGSPEVSADPEPQPEPAPPAPPNDKGFTLRFESDEALSRLVARDVVSLYAITASGTSRLSIDAGNPTFWAASTPDRIHEMDPSTVPDDLLAAWRRKQGSRALQVQWGVALPPTMSRQLNEFLSNNEGGSLIIGESGKLRLER